MRSETKSQKPEVRIQEPEIRRLWSELVGKRYHRGASGPKAYDCYSLAQTIAARRGFDLPAQNTTESIRMRLAMFEDRANEFTIPVETPQPFDLVVFDRGQWGLHIGTLTDEPGRFIHCSELTGKVEIERLRHPFHAHAIVGYWRCVCKSEDRNQKSEIRR